VAGKAGAVLTPKPEVKKSNSVSSSLCNVAGPKIEVLNQQTRSRLGLGAGSLSRSNSASSLDKEGPSSRVRAGSAASLLSKSGSKKRLNTLS
jgi:hypothetical protein